MEIIRNPKDRRSLVDFAKTIDSVTVDELNELNCDPLSKEKFCANLLSGKVHPDFFKIRDSTRGFSGALPNLKNAERTAINDLLYRDPSLIVSGWISYTRKKKRIGRISLQALRKGIEGLPPSHVAHQKDISNSQIFFERADCILESLEDLCSQINIRHESTMKSLQSLVAEIENLKNTFKS